jgi:hypothetical protein
MGFELHLILKGLCAVVPGGPVPADPTPSPHPVPDLKVLVLDAKAVTVPGFPICEHDPQIQAEQPQGNDLVVPLAGHRIEIAPLPASPPRVALNGSFWTVAHLNRVYADFTIDPLLLQNPPGRPGVVVAHLQLPAGTVSGFDPTKQVLSFPAAAPAAAPYSGKFARAVLIKVPIDGDSGTLTVTPFEDGETTEIMVKPKPGKSFVEVTLRNLCKQSDAQDALLEVDLEAPGRDRRDLDFAVYYRLEKSLREPILVPESVPGKRPAGEVVGTATDSGGSCIPARG